MRNDTINHMTDDYFQFLSSKIPAARSFGFDLDPAMLNPMLFDFQRDIVLWALRLGRAAIFAECGLGKTPMQLEWASQVCTHTGGDVLILTPLAVAEQTRREGDKFGIPVTICRTQADVRPGVNVTNYERLHHFDTGHFIGVVLDESSILKNFTGKTKQALQEAFRATPYRLACTATPAPNDHMELGNHAEFLGIMPSNEMLMRWFINDTMNFGSYRLKGHAQKDFWKWISSWAVCLSHPADLGYRADNFTLKPLHFHQHITALDGDDFGNGRLFSGAAVSATEMHREKRRSIGGRVEKIAELVSASDETWLIWCETNQEADALREAIPEAVEVRGSDDPDKKEKLLSDFAAGAFRVLITKPSIAGYGMNWQHCANMAFVSVTYSFESYYQAVRRSWRFGQERDVNVHIVMADTEVEIYDTVQRKRAEHEEMRREMVAMFKETGFRLQEERALIETIDEYSESGRDWTLHRGDSCQVITRMEDDSVGFTVFSPPFANLYIYSDSVADMGNCADSEEFFAHFRFLIRELLRVTMPGRLCAVHCKDLPRYAGRDGSAGLFDFPGEIVKTFGEEGWTYHSRVTIWKDPVIEMQRTKNHGLLYKNLRENSCVSRQGMADYIVVFRKWFPGMESLNTNPVPHELDDFPLQKWQEWASPVWMDIAQTNVLNIRAAKEGGDEKHICPLQLDVIERCITLWSNPGDVIFSPFAGIGSEGYMALKMKRKFVGVELKEGYFRMAVQNLERALQESGQFDIFDYIDECDVVTS